MAAVAASFDANPHTRARDNFLIFAAELEVYKKAQASLHICTVCPQGAPDTCFDSKLQYQAEQPPLFAGLTRQWGR